MTTDVRTRTAEPADAAAVARIYVDSWNAGFAGLLPDRVFDDAQVDRWREDLGSLGSLSSPGSPTTRWRIGEVDGIPVGFVGTGPSRDPVCDGIGELDTIAVDPARWHEGIGRHLLQAAHADLADAGFADAILWTLRDAARTRAFYAAAGWRPTGAARDDGRQIALGRVVAGAAERVRDALAAVPRVGHLPRSQQGYAALDRALPIGHGQTNSQPTTVRQLLTALDPRPGQRVLDVGSGSGWTTALLARLVGPDGSVLGLERVPELVTFGRACLAPRAMPWARIEPADPGVLGAPGQGPFDRILVSAMATEVPAELIAQLRRGGILVVPAAGEVWRVTHAGERHSLGRFAFVPLVAAR